MRIMFSRVMRLFLPFLLLVTAHTTGAFANPYISVDVQTGRVLAHKDAFDRWYPASLTKMMTAYVAFRALQAGEVNLETPVTITVAAAKAPPSRSGYKPGSTLTLDTALKIMLVKSANDVAASIGETVGGSSSAFVARMNNEAQRIGMVGTRFANANGLPDPDNYSTARDLALLTVQIRREFPQYAHYFDIPAIDFGDGRKVQPNSNNLIGRYPGADGMKTGFICASGFNLSASATRGNRTVVAVVLGIDRIDVREGLAAKLLSEGFKTKGSPQVTLATLRPYGTRLSQVTNLRGEICNEEAWKVRMQYRDEKGQTIFNSPFMNIMQGQPRAIPVRLISGPPVLKRGEIPAWKVPVPAERPLYN